MMVCPECRSAFYPGTLFCESCGAAVHPASRAHVAATRTPASSEPNKGRSSQPEDLTGAVTASGTTIRRLLVRIEPTPARLAFRAAVIRVGRADEEAGFVPDLDLTPYDGLEKGVSRCHATIRWADGGYVLIDEHSSNGTWLAGRRLESGRAYPLPQRASVRFGDLLAELTTAD